MTPEARYLRDPMFKRVVDLMEKIIIDAKLTPSEIREAAMLACINYEMRRPRRVFQAFEIDANAGG